METALAFECFHGVAQPYRPEDHFGAQSPCPDCRAQGRQWKAEVEAIEARLRSLLAPADPLHPDVYHGPYGSLWYQSAHWLIGASDG